MVVPGRSDVPNARVQHKTFVELVIESGPVEDPGAVSIGIKREKRLHLRFLLSQRSLVHKHHRYVWQQFSESLIITHRCFSQCVLVFDQPVLITF